MHSALDNPSVLELYLILKACARLLHHGVVLVHALVTFCWQMHAAPHADKQCTLLVILHALRMDLYHGEVTRLGMSTKLQIQTVVVIMYMLTRSVHLL